MLKEIFSRIIDSLANHVRISTTPKHAYTAGEAYTTWIDHLHGEIRMVPILDPEENEVCIVLEKQASALLGHLNRRG